MIALLPALLSLVPDLAELVAGGKGREIAWTSVALTSQSRHSLRVCA